METLEEQKKEVRVELSPISKLPVEKLTGIWELTYTTKNSQGPKAFGQYLLGAYDHPTSLLGCPLMDVQKKVKIGFWITNTEMRLTPGKDRNKFLELDWLISHPEVNLDDFEGLDSTIVDAKKKNSKIKLVCIDRIELTYLEDEDYIDKLIGVISLDLGKNALSLNRLRGILAFLGLPYQEMRFATQKTTEKKALRSRLKTFTRKSIENAKKVEMAIENKEECNYFYETKEMLRFGIITMSNGLYLYANQNMGTSYGGMIAWFHQHPEHYGTAQGELSKMY